jgi:hypothetical protein
MSESDMRRRVVKLLKPIGAFPVENPCLPGTPDINHWYGWIELKWVRSWPKRKNTIIRLTDFTLKQKRFLRNRWQGNQDAYLLVQINRTEWFLFKGNTVDPLGQNFNRKEFCNHAFQHWTSTVDMESELIKCLQPKNGHYVKD